MRRRVVLGTLVMLTLAFAAQSASANPIVVAPNSNTSTSGTSVQLGIFDTTSVRFQFVYSATQFSTLATGTEITSIGFRLPANTATLTSALTYSDFTIDIGKSTAAPGALSTTFATNEASDTVTALSGPLTIAGGSFMGGAALNPFFELTFATPYTYTGGNLLVTISHSDPGVSIAVDANPLSALSGVADTVANFGNASATTGQQGFFNAPVTAFDFRPAPEPATLALLGVGLAGLGLTRRRAREMQSTAV